jgi:hypothetical protein
MACGRLGWTAEPPAAASQRANVALELQQMVAARTSTATLAAWAEGLLRQARLQELGFTQLPWTTWNAPGWRWEYTSSTGERLVIATDGMVMVVIREGRQLELAVRDLTQTLGGYGTTGGETLLAEGMSAQTSVASSAADLARKAPKLFPIYYYFAGPTQEIVSSRLLPYPPLPLRN